MFDDVQLPDDFQWSSAYGVMFDTNVTQGPTLHEIRTQRADVAPHKFSLRKKLMTPEEQATLKAFGLARRGSFAGFKLKDHSDYTSNSADGKSAPTAIDQFIGTGDGVTKTFQLRKIYDIFGPRPYFRLIALPASGSVLVALDLTPTSAFTVNLASGTITFTTAPALGVIITAGFEFFVPVRFSKGYEQWMRFAAEDVDIWDGGDIEAEEIVGETEWPDRHNSGGGTTWPADDKPIFLSFNNGVFQHFSPTADQLVFLPVPTNAPQGWNIFTIANDATSGGDVDLRDDSGGAVVVIAPGTTWFIGIYKDAIGQLVWYGDLL